MTTTRTTPASTTRRDDAFAALLGMQVHDCSFQQATCSMQVQPERHHNALGGVHGAVIFSLADCAFAAACNAGDAPHIGQQVEVRYMGAARDAHLTATATLVGSSKKFAHYQMLVSDGQGHRVALLTATAYRLSA